VSKHSKNVQSRTEIRYVDVPCEPWYLGLGVPDASTALFLTWHKAGMRMPREFQERCAQTLQDRRDRLGVRVLDKEKEW